MYQPTDHLTIFDGLVRHIYTVAWSSPCGGCTGPSVPRKKSIFQPLRRHSTPCSTCSPASYEWSKPDRNDGTRHRCRKGYDVLQWLEKILSRGWCGDALRPTAAATTNCIPENSLPLETAYPQAYPHGRSRRPGPPFSPTQRLSYVQFLLCLRCVGLAPERWQSVHHRPVSAAPVGSGVGSGGPTCTCSHLCRIERGYVASCRVKSGVAEVACRGP